ncbi:cornifelin-like isoform X2 [Lineus longissimus]
MSHPVTKQPARGHYELKEMSGSASTPPPGYDITTPGYFINPPTKSNPIVRQPTSCSTPTKPLDLRAWTTPLCSCGDNKKTCFQVIFCALCVECWLSRKMGEGYCMPWCVPFSLSSLRLKLRTKYNIEGSILEDFCASLWCWPCVLCQLKSEVRYIERQNRKRQLDAKGQWL